MLLDYTVFIHSSIEKHLNHFQFFLAVKNCVLYLCIYSLNKCLLYPFHFLKLCFSLLQHCKNSLHFGLKFFTRYMMYKCFYPILWVLFSFSLCLWRTRVFNLLKFILSIFSLVPCAFGVVSKKVLPNPRL